jgi:hypothetical protein
MLEFAVLVYRFFAAIVLGALPRRETQRIRLAFSHEQAFRNASSVPYEASAMTFSRICRISGPWHANGSVVV